MELKEGMYARTKSGQITKLEKYLGEDELYENMKHYRTDKIQDETNSYYIYEEDIKKADYDIMQLIEVGDYVNGRYVNKYKGKLVVFTELPNGKWATIDLDNEHYYIASIVTKEQFKSMEYEVK